MAKPSLCLIISLAIIITISLSSAQLNNALSFENQSVANLSTTWINNPTIYISRDDVEEGFRLTPVLSPSDTSQFISGFYCFPNETSCFFGIVIFAYRDDSGIVTVLSGPQLVWSANRDRPVKVNATLKLTGNGNLILEDADGYMVWSTNTRGKSVTGLRFTETGNLVLFDMNNVAVWQSFDYPTNCLLLGQKLATGQKLIASTSLSDLSRGLYSLYVLNISGQANYDLYGSFEANPPLIYYAADLREAYVTFKDGSFNGDDIPLGSTTQFMRLEPDGHLKVYEWDGIKDGVVWKTVADLLTSAPTYDECGYPTVCGKYGICSTNVQCGCPGESSNGTGYFKKINYMQPNLGCSLVTPTTCNDSQYHSLLELKNTKYFNTDSMELDEKARLEDCKNACLRNCSCKAAVFTDASSDSFLARGCLLLSEVLSLINDEGGFRNTSIFLKVQNSPTKPSSPPTDFPPKKSRSGTIIMGSSLGAFFGVCLLVGTCIFVFKMKREREELDDEFSIAEVPGMPTRFSYDDLKTATNDFNKKLGEGGFGSVFQGTLSDGTEVAVKRLAGLSQIKKSFLAEVQTIGSIHHVNLVRLIGFCAENSNRLLVYEYMSNGSLDSGYSKDIKSSLLGGNPEGRSSQI